MTPERRVILLALGEVVRRAVLRLEASEAAFHALNSERLADAQFRSRSSRTAYGVRVAKGLQAAREEISAAKKNMVAALDAFDFAYSQPPTPPDLEADDP